MAKVTVHALSAGHLTLPERYFITPHTDANRYVPSLSFLIQHVGPDKTTRILFDLGLRRNTSLYPHQLEAHLQRRSPISTSPDVISSLAQGNLTAQDIDYVILSHVHYDHTGWPKDFDQKRTKFIVGPGALDVLSGKTPFKGTHSVFEPDLFPPDMIELPPLEASWNYTVPRSIQYSELNLGSWAGLPPFSHVLDIFGDSSVYIVSAPGHLPGHIALLCRVSPDTLPGSDTVKSQPDTQLETDGDSDGDSEAWKYVLLAGDACHDKRLLTSGYDVATWSEDGEEHCIHADIDLARQTIERIKKVSENGIEVLVDDSENVVSSTKMKPKTDTNKGIGKFMVVGDKFVEIQKGWYGDPHAQEPDRWDYVETSQVKKLAEVEVVLAHDEIWESQARIDGRFWPGQL